MHRQKTNQEKGGKVKVPLKRILKKFKSFRFYERNKKKEKKTTVLDRNPVEGIHG